VPATSQFTKLGRGTPKLTSCPAIKLPVQVTSRFVKVSVVTVPVRVVRAFALEKLPPMTVKASTLTADVTRYFVFKKELGIFNLI
jgi:hypothetical protein